MENKEVIIEGGDIIILLCCDDPFALTEVKETDRR